MTKRNSGVTAKRQKQTVNLLKMTHDEQMTSSFEILLKHATAELLAKSENYRINGNERNFRIAGEIFRSKMFGDHIPVDVRLDYINKLEALKT